MEDNFMAQGTIGTNKISPQPLSHRVSVYYRCIPRAICSDVSNSWSAFVFHGVGIRTICVSRTHCHMESQPSA